MAEEFAWIELAITGQTYDASSEEIYQLDYATPIPTAAAEAVVQLYRHLGPFSGAGSRDLAAYARTIVRNHGGNERALAALLEHVDRTGTVPPGVRIRPIVPSVASLARYLDRSPNSHWERIVREVHQRFYRAARTEEQTVIALLEYRLAREAPR